jgi:hypothetical protein
LVTHSGPLEHLQMKMLLVSNPLHGIYAYAQNKLSVMVEQLGALPPLTKMANVISDAEDEYLPSGPPMSPLTKYILRIGPSLTYTPESIKKLLAQLPSICADI